MSGEQTDVKADLPDAAPAELNTHNGNNDDAAKAVATSPITDEEKPEPRDDDERRDRGKERRERSRSRDRDRDHRRRRSRSRSRSRDGRRRSRSRDRDRRRRSRSRDRQRRSRSRDRDGRRRRRDRSSSGDHYGYRPRRRAHQPRRESPEFPAIEDPFAKLRQAANTSTDPADIARQMQEQQLKSRQLVLTQQAASAVAAASKTQREVYVGNLIPGVVTEEMLRQLFNSAMRAAFPDKCGPEQDPVVRVNLNTEGRYGFIELQSSEMASQCLSLNQQVPLMGQTLSIGRPTGYVDPVKAYAAAQAAAEALARFQADSEEARVAAGLPRDDSQGTNFLAVDGMVTADVLVDDQEYEDVLMDVRAEFERFGTVLRVYSPRPEDKAQVAEVFGTGSFGKVFVQYLEEGAGKAAKEAVDGRLFDGRTLAVTYLHAAEFIEAVGQT